MTNDRQAFIASAVLHVAALGLVAAFVFIKPFKPKEQPVVLELVTLPDDPQPAPTPPTPRPNLDQPDFTPPPTRALPKINIPEPEPEPAPTPPPPEPTPEPKPEPRVEPKPKPEPAPKPTPKPEPPKPKTMSIDDFKKSHGLPDQVRRDQPRQSNAPAPRIDTSNITKNLNSLSIKPSTSTAAKSSPLIAQYQARLVQAVELRWNKPPAGTGREWAEVSFQVSKNGTISNVRILKSNGPDAFITSIRQAIQDTPSIGPRPDGWNGEMTITFRLT
ncbi:MAG: energy transducer TonB [Puniceicoccales bacterium]